MKKIKHQKYDSIKDNQIVFTYNKRNYMFEKEYNEIYIKPKYKTNGRKDQYINLFQKDKKLEIVLKYLTLEIK